jgi:hypothetical protein
VSLGAPSAPPSTEARPETSDQAPAVQPPGDLASAAQTPEAGPGGGGSFNPRMFGDQFGGAIATVSIQFPPVVRTATFPILNAITNQSAIFLGVDQQTTLIPNPLPPQLLTVGGIPVNLSSITSAQPLDVSVEGRRFPVLETAVITAAMSQLAAPNEVVQFNPQSNAILTEAPIEGPTGIFAIEEVYDFIAPGQRLTVLVPNPSGGGAVGRTKVSEDNSPWPRDRVIFGFDYFSNVPLSPAGLDVRRFSPGIEKTFFDRTASIELRFPFASTLDSTVIADGITNTSTAFGNIHMTLKGLLYGTETLCVASGLGIGLPTASDVNVRLLDGTELIRIDNEAVILTPYVAMLLTPDDHFFFQFWTQVSFDAGGNPVAVNAAFDGLVNAGELNSAALAQFDAQIGYWVIRSLNPEETLRGLAPFVELHYNTTISDPDAIAAGAVVIADSAGNIDELNLTAGLMAQLGDRSFLSVGVVAPLRSGDDRFFDWQAGVRFNWFFGPTVREADRTTFVSGY